MIKSILDTHDEPTPAKPEVKADIVPESEPEVAEIVPRPEPRTHFELPEGSRFFKTKVADDELPQTAPTSDLSAETEADYMEQFPPAEPAVVWSAPQLNAAESIITADVLPSETILPSVAETTAEPVPEPVAEPAVEKDPFDSPAGTLFKETEPSPPIGEAIRQSGLAYAAAMVLFGAVVFMMLLGWFADLLLGSSPWGIVGGILLGGLIGFIQFFRLAAQIFKK